MFYCKVPVATHSQPTLSQLAEKVSNDFGAEAQKGQRNTVKSVEEQNQKRRNAAYRTSYEEVPRAVQPDPPSHSKREIELKCTNIESRAKYNFVSPQLSTGTYRIQ